MDKNMIFFEAKGKGLTSTSANHVANLAKEMIRDIESSLAVMSFYSTTVSLIGGEKPNVIQQGIDADATEDVVAKLRRAAEAKSLIAWLREAIKAKERMLTEAKELTIVKYAAGKGMELKPRPELAPILTEDEYWASKPLGERCRYYSLETLAATLGEAVHPGGEFAEARKQLQEKAKKPHQVEGKGRDTLIYSYEPTIDEAKVEDVYFRLQNQYREAQARLNAMKHECKKAVEESAVAAKSQFAKDLAVWANERKVLEAEMAEHIQQRTKEIAALRIVIPESLSGIYEEVTSLGKV